MSTARSGPVVVGADHSVSSRAAVVYAAWEAERRGVPLRLVYGYLVPTPCLTPLAPLLDEQTLLVAARDRLAKSARVVRSRRPHLPLVTRVARASGSAALIEESESAGLVVVGAPHLRGFAALPTGSLVPRLVAEARCPVVVVPRSEVVPALTPGAGPVLVEVDGSRACEPVLRVAFEEASARNVPLIAAHVWSVPELTGLTAVSGGVQWAADRDRAQVQMQENAERLLAEALAGWQDRYPDVTVRRWIVHGFGTARILLEVAREVSAGLLVVGSSGRGAVAGAVLGSVSQVLINHASMPVAVVGPLAGPRAGVTLPSGRVRR